jgi:hypothetical protein
MDLEELKRLNAVDAKSILSRSVDPLGTEYDVVKDALAGIKKIRIGYRELTLPGLDRNSELVMKVLAEYKSKEKRNVMPLQYAKSDDIVVSALRPQLFGIQMYIQDVTISANKYTAESNIIPQATGSYSVPTKQIFIITDFVDMVAESPVTAIQAKDVDGVSQFPCEVRKDLKISDLHVIELDYPIIADASLDIDALVVSKTAAATVTHELTPMGVWIGMGKDVPKLRTEA